jgi:hypothetical protein
MLNDQLHDLAVARRLSAAVEQMSIGCVWKKTTGRVAGLRHVFYATQNCHHSS